MEKTAFTLGAAGLKYILLSAGFAGIVWGIHHSGHVHERKILAKSAEKAAERKDKAVTEISEIEDKADPFIQTETKTIIKYDTSAAQELGRVRGELEGVKRRYEKILLGDWGDTPLPDSVRDEIAEIDDILSRL